MDIRIKKSIAIINHIVAELEFDNPKQFSDSLDFKRPERIYKILRGETSISRNLAGIINKNYPQYSKEWLLTGEGEMLKGEYAQEEEKHSLPNAEEGKSREVLDLKTVRDELRADSKEMLELMNQNFTNFNEALFYIMKDTQNINKFVNKVDVSRLNEASKALIDLMKERK